MAKGDAPVVPPTVTQVVVNTKSTSQKKGNLSLAPMVARGMGAAKAIQAAQGKTKTADSPPQNLQNPLTALFGNRMTSRKPK